MHKFKKFIMIFGIEYSVLWSLIIYLIWDGPFVFTVLDLIAGIVLIYLGYKIYKDRLVIEQDNYLYTLLVLTCLIYNSIWTLVIMLFLEIDLAGLGLPLDLISLYATGSLSYSIWHTIKQRFMVDA